ncbi:hypothetical protein ACNF42_00485 [Cuniculiplasma sp. SKW3]|uniref:hypothetical protein n=1 Tax=Cuniculiplasma sp. SKW3 TaxID=3400170 RepID=UPI003FD4306D
MTRYFSGHEVKFLADNTIETTADKSFMGFELLGVVFQASLAVKELVLKHASILTDKAHKIEWIFNIPTFREFTADGSRAISAIKYLNGISFTD